jgi:D-alanine-D-alanine ligase
MSGPALAGSGAAAGGARANATRRVAVLKGGRSLERKVSLRSGAQVQDALQRLGHDVVAIDAGPELVAQLRAAAPDAAFVALHGRDGEDGTVQELLEAIGVPYTGPGAAACIRCADKVLAKHLMREVGIPTPDFYAFNEDSFKELGATAALPDIERRLGFPMVVKPASQGSALGIKFARTSEDLPSALVAAFSYGRKILLERYVRGRDLAVSVLDCESPAGDPAATRADGDPGAAVRQAADGGGQALHAAGDAVALPVVEAVPREEDFYNYESRYEVGLTTFVCPAELPAATTARAKELALAVYRLLGCHGVARVDLMLDEDSGELTVLETNVIPGLTETSLLPQAADAAGIDFDALVGRILASAWTRGA